MIPPNPANIVKIGVGVAGGSALIAPVALPVVHGLAGIAVVGVGIFSVGSLIFKAAGAINNLGNTLKPKG